MATHAFAPGTYDARGREETAVDPSDKVTKVVYDDLGRRIAVIENYDDATYTWGTSSYVVANVGDSDPDLNASTDRLTSYEYDASGNLVLQTAHVPGDAQTTQYVYNYATAFGSSSVGSNSSSANTLVASNDMLHYVRYPDESTGDPGATGTPPSAGSAYTALYSYNQLGELRSTTDQNATRHGYARDGLGRVTRDAAESLGTDINGAVRSLVVTYDNFGRLDQARSTSDTGGSTVVNDSRFRYTPLWQIKYVYQDHDGAVATTGTPDDAPSGNSKRIAYTYSTSNSSASNYSRPATLAYPTDSQAPTINFLYIPTGSSSSGTLNQAISRVMGTEVQASPSPIGLAEYHYIGLDLPAVVDYPAIDIQLDRTYSHDGKRRFGGLTSQAQGHYPSLDRFGRVVRQAWLGGALDYNSGNSLPNDLPLLEQAHTYDRLSNRLTNYDDRPGASQSDRDRQHSYDGLDRLKEAKKGAWNSTGSTFTTAAGSQQWALDMLGNWTEFRRDLTGDGDYSDSAEVETRVHNAANELYSRDLDGTGTGASLTPFTYDDAGNMRRQTRTTSLCHQYTHDAWGRLVKVEATGDCSVPSPTWTTIQQNEYNALHWRTVRRLDTTPAFNGLDQERRLYYSAGWQLLHEDIADAYTVSTAADRNAVQFWGKRHVDDAVGRRVYIPPGGIGSGTTSWYFYGTDVQFSVNAVVRGPGTGAGRLVERVGYDAYGLARHHYHDDVDGDGDTDSTDSGIVTAALGTSIGGSGYKADADIDRDGDVDSADSALVATGKAALAAGVQSVGSSNGVDNPVGFAGYLLDYEVIQNTVRHRRFDPVVGRWLSRDPAGYVDGRNLYQYCKSNSLTYLDAMGLDAGWANRPGNDPYGDYLGCGLKIGIAFEHGIWTPAMKARVRLALERSKHRAGELIGEIDTIKSQLSPCVAKELGPELDELRKRMSDLIVLLESDGWLSLWLKDDGVRGREAYTYGYRLWGLSHPKCILNTAPSIKVNWQLNDLDWLSALLIHELSHIVEGPIDFDGSGFLYNLHLMNLSPQNGFFYVRIEDSVIFKNRLDGAKIKCNEYCPKKK